MFVFPDKLHKFFRQYVLQCTGANIFFIKDGVIHTPLADRFLNGLTRQSVIDQCKKRGFEVEVLDITTNAVARDAFNLSGAKGVPTILAGKQMLGGWSDKHFDRLLKDDIQQKIQEQRGTGG